MRPPTSPVLVVFLSKVRLLLPTAAVIIDEDAEDNPERVEKSEKVEADSDQDFVAVAVQGKMDKNIQAKKVIRTADRSMMAKKKAATGVDHPGGLTTDGSTDDARAEALAVQGDLKAKRETR